METEKRRKRRTTITKEIVKTVRKAHLKEKTTIEIAEELEISISSTRSICQKIANGLTDDEIACSKKGRPPAQNNNLKSELRVLIERDPSIQRARLWRLLRLFAIFLLIKDDLIAVKYICVINNI